MVALHAQIIKKAERKDALSCLDYALGRWCEEIEEALSFVFIGWIQSMVLHNPAPPAEREGKIEGWHKGEETMIIHECTEKEKAAILDIFNDAILNTGSTL
jgi:hypothetical protein